MTRKNETMQDIIQNSGQNTKSRQITKFKTKYKSQDKIQKSRQNTKGMTKYKSQDKIQKSR